MSKALVVTKSKPPPGKDREAESAGVDGSFRRSNQRPPRVFFFGTYTDIESYVTLPELSLQRTMIR